LIQLHINVRKVSITRRHTTAVIDNHQLPVTILPAHKRHMATRSRNYRSAPRRLDILSGMKLVATPAERVSTSPKTAFERSFDGPDSRCITTLSKNGFVSQHVLFEPARFGGKGRQAHVIKRQGRAAASMQDRTSFDYT